MKNYLREIDYPSLLEFIDEKFDNISNFLTSNSVMYGSSITSLLSGIPSDGDLDVSVSPNEYSTLVQRLHESTKWLYVDGEPPRENHGWKSADLATISVATLDNPYATIPDFPLEKTVAFKNVSGAVVQVIKSRSNSGDPLHDALEVVRKVDFAFCGMALDKYGRLMEAVPHAFDDCKAGIIRIANYRPGEDPKHVRDRLDKYVKRGWGLSITYDTVFANLKAVTEKQKKEDEKPKKKAKKKAKPEFNGYMTGTFTGRISSHGSSDNMDNIWVSSMDDAQYLWLDE